MTEPTATAAIERFPQTAERRRLLALRSLGLLDTAPSASFDRITRLASQIFDLPIAAVSLTDENRQWFKSRIGLEQTEVPRDKAPCAEVIEKKDVLVLRDLLQHDKYADSLLAQHGIRFYAGAPLITRDGYGLGTMCVLGTEPREVTDDECVALRDLAALVMAQIELEHAFGRVDPVTGLPSRNQFIEDVQDFARDEEGETRYATLIDFAHPSELAQTMRVLGPAFIDSFMDNVTREIGEAFGEDQRLYMAGNGQCIYLVDQIDEKLRATEIEKLRRCIQKTLSSTNPPVLFTSSIGVVPFQLGESDPQDVIRMAHSAAEEARHCDRKLSFYSPQLDEAERRRYRLLADIREAIRTEDQLYLAYQPRIDVASHKYIGAEALIRWTHPELGNIAPGEFIPLLEQTSLTRELTAWVIDTAVRQMAAWKKQGMELNVSVNISAENLGEGDFAARLIQTLQQHEIDPETLELELTEGAILKKGEQALRQLNVIDQAGVVVAIDDFGTGYSNLAYLLDIPAGVVKLDRSLVQALGKEDRSRTLVRTLFTTLHNLGYRVVAEGVETIELFEALQKERCDEAQGFLFSPALAPKLFEEWVRVNSKHREADEEALPHPLPKSA
ncbi:EAL domain-containing protein [Methyloligella solikamskensis]|uniref:EAL domain-containing protein n=1 Tax=Methyloligella solikamskensis TaxID=1177756 RepID=A0ABW3J823_9HYPH